MERMPATQIETPPRSSKVADYKRDPLASKLAEVSGFQFTCNACPYLMLAEKLEADIDMNAEACIFVKESLNEEAIKVPCGMAAFAVAEQGLRGEL